MRSGRGTTSASDRHGRQISVGLVRARQGSGGAEGNRAGRAGVSPRVGFAPGLLDARLSLADLFIQRGQLEEAAEDVLLGGIARFARHAGIYLKLAEIRAKQHRYDEPGACNGPAAGTLHASAEGVCWRSSAFERRQGEATTLLHEARPRIPIIRCPRFILGQLARRRAPRPTTPASISRGRFATDSRELAGEPPAAVPGVAALRAISIGPAASRRRPGSRFAFAMAEVRSGERPIAEDVRSTPAEAGGKTITTPGRGEK